ncbi:farnesyl-diphosphate synthase [Peribacillus deserti]|uniref:Farnesyl diphosphate synthase n=2 Tax=Peribacillus deserti TaxID=673318 RepID=A0A2N5M4E7_9BACI|nr:farnesyl-diphosphate synthase [Peribacillus deserti]
MIYSLKAGGKRIRPLLIFAVLDAFGRDPKIGLKPAAAIEMIHTYSLIHDDLPSMDNDDLRRGKPTNHKVFGEAAAILAGDALLTYAFELLAALDPEKASAETKLLLVKELAVSAGAEGMVGGQTADIEAEGKVLNLTELEYIHRNKTGKLLTCSVMMGALLADSDSETLELLRDFSRHIGLAFQIQDDILDIIGMQDKIGKPVGSDVGNQKNTYPALLTLDGAKEKLSEHIQLAKQSLAQTSLNIEMLLQLTDLIAVRDH